MTLEKAIEMYLRKCRIRNLAPETITGYKLSLTTFKNFYEGSLEDLIQDDIDDYSLYLQEQDLALTTVNNRLRNLRAFINWTNNQEITKGLTVGLARQGEIDIIPLTGEDLKELYATCLYYNGFCNYRDYVIMRLLEETGIRIGECINIKINHLDLTKQTIRIIDTKNGKNRVAYITPFLHKELLKYLDLRQEVLTDKKLAATSLFITHLGTSLAKRTIQERITNYAELAGLTHIRVSPHTFRHTFARNFLINGGDIFTLQELLGHSTLDMVRRYVRLFDTDRQDVYNKVMGKYNKSKKQPYSIGY